MKKTVFWFRRDLRLNDNAALYHALKENKNVLPVFIFDKEILSKLEDKYDRRVTFIYKALLELNNELIKKGSSLFVYYGKPVEIFNKLIEENGIDAVYANHDYEPEAIYRDEKIKKILAKKNIQFYTYKDQCIFEKNEVVKEDGKPYTIFTPYMRKWKERLNDFYVKPFPTEKYFHSFVKIAPQKIPAIQDIGFVEADCVFPDKKIDTNILKNYAAVRDIPALNGTSRISVHLRFGTISIRGAVCEALKFNDKWLNELIWRDFYMMILFHFPHVVNSAFKPAYDKIKWRNNEAEFEKWCNGLTGYPIVDAGIRELNNTGFMHNRVRMITASFLTKHLLIDWRWGEAYFAQKLMDFELSSNNGGWQWAAGTGCDAAPYFRIFNPYEQTKKFDPQLKYIKMWVPELDELTYPAPIINHSFARKRALEVYKKHLK